MNDGQDFVNMNLEKTLAFTFSDKSLAPFIYVGIETNENRMREYGIAASSDYKGRGNKASRYSRFILEEFIPFLQREFKISQPQRDWVYCGMSLGGLSAFDMVYNHPDIFGKVGVFSGSFWWRNKAYVKKDMKDRSRIILDVIQNRVYHPHLKFWFQCGTDDELADRNNNGVIDAIDDTLDVIKELQKKGYSYPGDITYVELEGGKHDLPTWSSIFPEFIKWAFRKKFR
jgi:enterochelin esterase-like enzyme